MSSVKDHVTIKGNKDGLIFVLNDSCDFEEITKELTHKLENAYQKFLSGPSVNVQIRLGNREINVQQHQQLNEIIQKNENLVLQHIEGKYPEEKKRTELKVIKGMIRSGQTIEHEGDLLLLGDINPGGTLRSTGNLFIMGALRGMAHAGSEGDQEAIISASYLKPTQLRIADIISRPPDEWEIHDAIMEFAYLKDGVMKIDKTSQLYRVRPDICEYKGE